MERITRVRVRIVLAIFAVIVLFFAFKLYDLQIIQTGGKTDNSSTFTTRVRVKAARGDILDRNGNILVGNRASYDLTIIQDVLISAKGTNEHLYRLVTRSKELGIAYADHFPVSQERPFVYLLDQQSSAWQSYFQQYMAKTAQLDSDITAPLLVETLSEMYKFPAEWTEEECRAVLGLWYELDLRRCVDALSQYVFMSDISDEHLAAMKELNIPGLNVEASTVREYHTKYAAHILGFVGPMTPAQWETYKTQGYAMDAHVGQDGIEKAFEQYLHGVDGLREDTVSPDGKLISSRFIIEPKAGSNVELTLDINLQRQAEEQLAITIQELQALPEDEDGHDASGGAVVAMDTRTGGVLACASYPTYDLTTYFEKYSEILEADNDPLFNRALLGTYPPGSTYKMSMVIAGIHSGKINSTTNIYDKGIFDTYKSAGFAPQCLQYTNYRQIHGDVNAAEALQVSCNYFFYELADRIPLSLMDDTAKSLGLGEPTGIELYENIGHRANEETKKKLYKGDDAKFFQADKITAAIGQSDNRFTPMQLCVYVSTLANRGTRYKATFLNRVVSSDYRELLLKSEKTVMSHMDITDDAYLAYSTGMNLVTKRTEKWRGTGFYALQGFPVEVCAKTGTAQSGSLISSDHGAFVCYAPMQNPEISIAVYGEKAGHGSSLGAVARSIMEVYFDVGEAGEVGTSENKPS